MTKESKYHTEQQDIIFFENFNSEQEVRRNGGDPDVGATSPTFSLGEGNLDGITAQINYPLSKFRLCEPERPFSIRTRVYLTDTDASVFLQLYDAPTTNKSFRFMIAGNWPLVADNDRFVLELWDEVGTAGRIMTGRMYDSALTTAAKDKWVEFVATYDGRGGATAQDGICLYIDGVRVDDTDIDYDLFGGNYVQMRYFSDLEYEVGRNVEGKMDVLEVWNRVLTPEEVANMAGV